MSVSEHFGIVLMQWSMITKIQGAWRRRQWFRMQKHSYCRRARTQSSTSMITCVQWCTRYWRTGPLIPWICWKVYHRKLKPTSFAQLVTPHPWVSVIENSCNYNILCEPWCLYFVQSWALRQISDVFASQDRKISKFSCISKVLRGQIIKYSTPC